MNKRTLPTPEELRKLLRCEPTTGKLYWRERDVGLFNEGTHTAEHSCAKWNSRLYGEEAFVTKDGQGYLRGAIFDKKYRAHRVIWAMHHGEWPEGEIDHINHDRSDNRMENLRIVTSQENKRNAPLQRNNTSGHVGVSWGKRDKKWMACIKVCGKTKHLGVFTDITDAISAREAANIKYGFHKNHGTK